MTFVDGLTKVEIILHLSNLYVKLVESIFREIQTYRLTNR